MPLPWTQIWQIWHKRQMGDGSTSESGRAGPQIDPQAASSSEHPTPGVPTRRTNNSACHGDGYLHSLTQGLGSQLLCGAHPGSRRWEQTHTLQDGARDRWASAAGFPGQKPPARTWTSWGGRLPKPLRSVIGQGTFKAEAPLQSAVPHNFASMGRTSYF
jgi:hypothetical protein